jgi:hypothetical protein
MATAMLVKRRRVVLAVLVISLFVLSIPQMLYVNPASVNGSQSGDSTSLQPDLPSASYASGPTRPVSEYALGTRAGQTVGLPSSPNAYIDLGSGWVGNSATVDVTNLWDSRNQAVNGTFDSGSGTSSPPWSFSKYDPPGYPQSTFTGTWVNNLPQSGNKTVQCQMPLPSGSITLGGNDRVSWNETILPLRGTVLSASLIFNWYPVVASGFTRSEFIFYATINNTRLVGVGTPFPWEYNLKDVASNPSVDNHWNLASLTIPASAFNLPSKKISIEIGIMYTSGVATYSGWNSQNIMYIDNVRLILQAYAKPHQVNLKVRPQGYTNTTVSDGVAYGSGTAKNTGFTTSGTSFPFIFSCGNLTSSNTAGLTCALRVNATRQTTATSTFEGHGSGQNISWSFSFRTYFSGDGQPIGSGPTYYSKYYFNLSIPSDYYIATANCTDPNGVFHRTNLEANNFTKFLVGSNWILRVNVTRIGSYTGPSNPPPSFLPYQISAFSSNYVKQVWTQMKNGAVYTNETKFYPQNWTRFAAYIAGVGGPITGGTANLTISGPPTYGASPVVLTTVTGASPSAGYAYFLVHWNSTNAAGDYTGEVDWADSLLGEAGALTCNYNITHKFFMYFAFPANGTDVITANSVLSAPPTTLKVLDYYTNESLTGVAVRGRAKWESAGVTHVFNYSADNIAYTNITHVPNLPASPPPTWIAANATKLFYDKGTANTTINVGVTTYCAPASTPWTVYYTESEAFYKDVNVTYEDSVHSPVSDATITLLTDVSSNDSVVHWALRTTVDTSKNAEGKYSARIRMFTQTAKGLPSGHVYYIWFRLSKGLFTQTQTFNMQLVVESQPSVLNVWTGNGQSIFWGDTALVQINFTTQQAGSGHDWPVLHLPINNRSYYIPPYVSVTVNQGANKWNYNWTVQPDQLYPGTYDLYFDTRLFPNPTPSGTLVTIDIGFHKPYYNDPTGVAITLSIKSLTTSETGAIWNGAAYSLTNTTSVFPADSKSIFIWYNDTHTGLSTGVGGATVSYTSSGGLLGSGTLTGVAGKLGLYNLTLAGVVTNQTPGIYYLYVAASRGSYYVPQSITLTLTIDPLTTDLQAVSSSESVFYLDRVVFLIWFADTHNGIPVSGATMTVTAPGVTLVSPFEVPGQPGLWNLTIPSGQAVGHFSISIQANKTKYAIASETLTLDISSLPTLFASYIVTSSGSVLVQPNATIPQGQTLTIYLWFNDTRHGVPIAGMENSITYTSTEFGHGWVSATTTPGLYEVTFQTPDAGIFDITFAVSATGYQSQSITFHAIVQAPPPGFSIFTLMLVGAGGGGIVIAAVGAMIFIRRARMPFIIKKINETLGLINKGEHEQATPVPLKSREEAIAGIMTSRVESFTKRKPSKEEEEAGEEVAPPPPPSPETSAALKQELQAVEGKEKPEEGIEEVEMDTLDEQLQQLEKVETKENLPDGAKEVRDVIEKYKEGKKKKK